MYSCRFVVLDQLDENSDEKLPRYERRLDKTAVVEIKRIFSFFLTQLIDRINRILPEVLVANGQLPVPAELALLLQSTNNTLLSYLVQLPSQ